MWSSKHKCRGYLLFTRHWAKYLPEWIMWWDFAVNGGSSEADAGRTKAAGLVLVTDCGVVVVDWFEQKLKQRQYSFFCHHLNSYSLSLFKDLSFCLYILFLQCILQTAARIISDHTTALMKTFSDFSLTSCTWLSRFSIIWSLFACPPSSLQLFALFIK